MFNDFSEKVVGLLENIWPKLPGLILTLIVGYLLVKLGIFLFTRTLKILRINKALQGLLISLSILVLWVMIIAEMARQAGLSNLAITISSTIFALGFAIANGASAMAADIIAGLSLAKDRDFECGYKIQAGDVVGTVKKIDMRKVRLEDDKGNITVIPNGKLDNTIGWTVIDRNLKD